MSTPTSPTLQEQAAELVRRELVPNNPRILLVEDEGGHVPDLEDAGNLGILLSVARVRWNRPHIYVYYDSVSKVFRAGGLPVYTQIHSEAEGGAIAELLLQAPMEVVDARSY